MDLWNTIQALFGKSTPPTVYPTNQPTHYPTDEDAEFAKKNDYSYGQAWAPEFEGKSARLLTGSPNARPLEAGTYSSDRLDQSKFGKQINDQLRNYYAKAALASQNSALATLGFNPSKTAADVTRDPKNVNIAGGYFPRTDEIYANALDPSTIVHESIHRGINKLKESPFWKPEFGKLTDNYNEEMVRHLMSTKMGDPEGGLGETDKKQRDRANYLFKDDAYAVGKSKLLQEIEEAAAQYIAKKRPGGPR